MGYEPARCTDGQLVVSRQRTGRRLTVTLSGRLDLDGVEDLAACTDQICRSAVSAAVFDVAGVTAVDEAGARTLAAAFGCLAAHRVAAWVRGVGDQLQAMLDRLALTLPARPSGDLVGLGAALQGAAVAVGVGYASRGDGGHDLAELPGLLRGDAVKERPPDLLDV
jgi:anti-anti-sigma regulatory factor